MRIALCDNNIKIEDGEIEQYTIDFSNSQNEVFRFTSEEELTIWTEKENFDLYLLGIDSFNGVQIAKEIRMRYPDAKLVFLSSSPKLVEEALELTPIAYLLKPIYKEALSQLLQDNKDISITQVEGYFRTNNRELKYFLFKEITYAEKVGNVIRVHLTSGKWYDSPNLRESFKTKVSNLLAIPAFEMIGKSFVINKEQLDCICEDYIKMRNGEIFYPSKAVLVELRKKIGASI